MYAKRQTVARIPVMFAHLKRKSWLFIVNPDKYFTDDQLFTVISKHKFCPKAVISFSLLTDKKKTKRDAWIIN